MKIISTAMRESNVRNLTSIRRRLNAQNLASLAFVMASLLILASCFGRRADTTTTKDTVTLSTNAVDFGNVPVGQTVEQQVGISFDLEAESTLTVFVSGANFGEKDDCVSQLLFSPKGKCTATLSVTPSTIGPLTGTMTVKTSGKPPVTINVPLKANGVAPAPSLASISPNSVAAGSSSFPLTVTGKNFVNGSQVMLGTAPMVTTFVNSTTLTASIPASFVAKPGTVQVSVTTAGPGGGPSNALPLTITSTGNPVPTLTAVSPNSATAGMPTAVPITLTGTNFVPGADATWAGISLPTTFVSSTQLTSVIPPGLVTTAGSVPITVVNPGPGGGTSGAVSFTITLAGNPPTLTSVLPNSATAGTQTPVSITLKGSGFVAASQAMFGTAPIATTFVDATTLMATVPITLLNTPGTVQVTVVNPGPGGGTSGQVPFTISSSGGNNNALLTGPHVVKVGGVDSSGEQVDFLFGFNADGNGSGNNCTFNANGAGQILDTVPCTFSYNLDLNDYLILHVAPMGFTNFFGFGGYRHTSGNFGVILGAAPSPFPTGGAGTLLVQDPTAFNLAAQQGPFNVIGHFFWQNQPGVLIGQGVRDANGNANPMDADLAQPGSHSFAPGDFNSFLNPIAATDGRGTGSASFLGVPPNFTSFLAQVESFTWTHDGAGDISVRARSADSPDRYESYGSDNSLSLGHVVRVPFLSAIAASGQLTGTFTYHLQGIHGSGASATNSTMQLQFVTDGAGNITSGVLDQNNGGTITASVNIAGSTITPDSTTPGRFTMHLNSHGAVLIDSDFTAYVDTSGSGFVMAGTPANPSTQLGLGVFQPQTGGPFSAASFGSGCPVVSVKPIAPNTWSLGGSMDFSAGIINFKSTFYFVSNGTFTPAQAITGTFTITDPNTGRFTGNLTGFPGTTGAVVGYLNAPNLFNFSLSTGSTSSALIICTGK